MGVHSTFFVPGGLTFDLDTQTCRRDQARLPYEFDANPFSVFRDF